MASWSIASGSMWRLNAVRHKARGRNTAGEEFRLKRREQERGEYQVILRQLLSIFLPVFLVSYLISPEIYNINTILTK